MGIEPDSRVKIGPDIHTRMFDGELVVLDLVRGDYFGLNPTGALLWEGLVAGKTPRQIATEMTQELEIDLETLLSDLVRLTDELIARGLAAPAD